MWWGIEPTINLYCQLAEELKPMLLGRKPTRQNQALGQKSSLLPVACCLLPLHTGVDICSEETRLVNSQILL